MRQVLIFDLDDTIVKSFPSYAALHQRVAMELGWPVPTVDELVPYGHDWVTTLGRLFPDRELEAFMTRYNEVAHEHPYEVIPGVLPALGALREAGHPLFIVTKRDRSRLASRLREAGVPTTLFDGIYPREDQPVSKPSPRCFEPVWAALGVKKGPDLSPLPIYVGDRNEDRIAATEAGIRFVGVRTGPEVSLGFPHETDPSHVIESTADLPAWLSASAR